MNSNLFLITIFSIITGIMTACDQNITKNQGTETMRVKVISLKNCSATLPTIRMVKDTAAELGITIDFNHVIVRTPEEAKEHRLIGSPTVQINGIDIEPQARDITQFGIT